jgi:hypothetical protein
VKSEFRPDGASGMFVVGLKCGPLVGRALPDRAPFRKTPLSDEEAAAAYHGPHNLREMYTRENTERRRVGGHTLRRYLTTAQDKTFIAKALKFRDEYEVSSNDDIVVLLVQQWIAEGKEAEIDPKLVAFAKKATVPKRKVPFDPTPGKGH